jgi:Concanavalin A-like lectin/glucanases superfamily
MHQRKVKALTRLLAAVAAALTLATFASPALGSSGLVGHWPLNEGVGTHIADISGLRNDGVLSGGATWVPGVSGSALSFDGQTGQVRIPNSPSLSPASSVTVSAWVRHAGSPGDYRYIVAKGATGCIAASYGLYTGPNGGLQFYVSQRRGTTYARSADDGLGVWDGRWHLVVGTFDGTAIRLFVDGSEVGSSVTYPGALEYDLPNSNDFYIGDYTGCQQHEFLGAIDDVRVWSRALTPQQVKDLMPAGGGGSTSPPTLPSPPVSGAGGGTSTSDGTSHTGTPGSGVPSLSGLRLSGTVIRTGTGRKLGHRTGLTITYTDAQGSRVTLTVARVTSGMRIRGRCLAPRKGLSRHVRSCTRLVVLGSFTHDDLQGRTTLHFTGLPGRRLSAGRYRLIITPRSSGQTGKAVVVAFSVR